MRTTHFKALGFLFLCCLIISSCQLDEFKDIDRITYEAEFALPLVNTSVTIQDFLDRSSNDLSSLTIEDDGSFTLSYQEEVKALKGEESLNKVQGTFPLPVPEQNTMLPLSILEEVSINAAEFKTGDIRFNLSSPHAEDLNVTITFPGIIQNGEALVFNTTIDYDGTTPSEISTELVDLTNYILETNGGDLEIQYQALNNSNQSRDIQVLGEARNWTFKQITGDWSQQNFSIESDTLEIDLYNNQVEGDLFFSDPKLGITINNSFGVPALVKLNNVRVLTTDNQLLTFNSTDLNNGLLVDAPLMTQIGESKQSVFSIDKTNSNIDVIFNSKPTRIWYDVEIQLAPGTEQTSGFIFDESNIEVMVSFELPIYGTAKNFAVEEIVAIDFGEDEDSNFLKEAQLKLITTNEIPIDAGLQLYFLNNAGAKVDSIFSNFSEVLKSNAPEVVTFFDLTESRLNIIRNSKNIMIRSEFSTTNNGSTPVRIKKDQELQIKLGLRATIVQ